MPDIKDIPHHLYDKEVALLKELRTARQNRLRQPLSPSMSVGDRVADKVAATVGSWGFIIIQTIVMILWMTLNVSAFVFKWDPYPFILLNLALSFQAAYAAPFIMMSQNRQAEIDRQEAHHDYQVNMKAELEIELLHQKIDQLKDQEITELRAFLARIEEKLSR